MGQSQSLPGEADGRAFQAGGTACPMAWGPEKAGGGEFCVTEGRGEGWARPRRPLGALLLALNLLAVLTQYELIATITKRIAIITIPIILMATNTIGSFLSARHCPRHLPCEKGAVFPAAQCCRQGWGKRAQRGELTCLTLLEEAAEHPGSRICFCYFRSTP